MLDPLPNGKWVVASIALHLATQETAQERLTGQLGNSCGDTDCNSSRDMYIKVATHKRRLR